MSLACPIRLAESCTLITKGTTPTTFGMPFQESGVPFVRAQNLIGGTVSIDADPLFISESTHQALQRSQIKPADVLVSIAGTIGRSAIVPDDVGAMNCNQAVAIIRPNNEIDRRFLLYWLGSREALAQMSKGQVTGTISNLSLSQIGNLTLRLPPIDEQRRIAAILVKADALRRKRKSALDLLDSLTQSIFLEMFGDPALNPKGYQLRTFGEIADKMSDGPFGSNLKSEHYVEAGVRIVRLQNIGVGRFIDDDRAFISEEHSRTLLKHECHPDDVLIGTMGDPNLRACLQPAWLIAAINKADCVQLQPKKNIALPAYLASLINQPSTERLAQSIMLGQTRTRISMGRLRELRIPVAPLQEQREFVSAYSVVRQLEDRLSHHSTVHEELFNSLQSRAFSGQL